jgi:endonuclease/exonuclease/phosphatase (EEP) superfamily protein YafD
MAMFRRILAAALIIAFAAALLVVAWPQLFELHRVEFAAHAVSLRGAGIGVAMAMLAILLVLSAFVPSFRRLGASLSVLLVAFVAVNGVVLASRGFGGGTSEEPPSAAEGLTVLSWNTLGPATDPAEVADLALTHGADIVVLPETIEANAIETALAMREGGSPMWVLTQSFDKISPARSTSLLVSVKLGQYEFDDAAVSTAVLPTVVATPADGTGPTIVAVHAVAPTAGQMNNWRSDLALLSTMCSGENVIMAGDFNSTIDHFSGLGTDGDAVANPAFSSARLGGCTDAAAVTRSAAVGTWPTHLPALLGAPIDHVMVTDNWTVDAFRVIESLDGTGSDHRPIVAWLSPVK